MWCSACGQQLGDPQKELHDPKGEFIEDLGVIENPDEHHIRVVYGEKGMRTQCAVNGQMTKILNEPPEEEQNEQQQGDPSGGAPKQPQQPPGPVYDLEEDKDAEDVLREVVTNPAYELNEDQINEIVSWADIYDGKIPADMVEDILGNLSGVSKQKAKLMRQKYEALMNKWLQQTTSDSGGPAIGSFSPPTPGPQGAGGPQRPQQHPQQQGQPQQGQPKGQPQQPSPETPADRQREIRKSGREKREERRQEVIDTFAEQMAQNMAQDAGRMYSDFRQILVTVMRRKAEKDPDWFLEKADEFGMDFIDQLSEPSEAMKEASESQSRSNAADQKVDQAVEEIMGDQSPPPQQTQPQQSRVTENQNPEPKPQNESRQMGDTEDHPMKAAPEDDLDSPEDEEQAFEEIMSEVAE